MIVRSTVTAEPLPQSADAGHLTAALRRSGVLSDGRVCKVAIENTYPTVVSRVVRLRLTYEPDNDAAPRFVIFKTAFPGRDSSLGSPGREEVAFYNEVVPAKPTCLAPTCFDARWDEDTKAWHLLLEDLSESHTSASSWPLPPTAQRCEAILVALARFHAAWWDDPRLGVSIGTWRDDETIKQNLQGFSQLFAAFADRLGDLLSDERRDLYRRLVDKAPGLLARYHSHRNVTLVHGDAHVWNCFLPKHERSGDVRFFDWQNWRTGIPTYDLAYMMAMYWPPDLRRRRERPLLDRYHAALLAHGVTGYDRRALADDYRLSVLLHLMTPVLHSAFGIPPWFWWNNLEHIMQAADDLGCRALLDG